MSSRDTRSGPVRSTRIARVTVLVAGVAAAIATGAAGCGGAGHDGVSHPGVPRLVDVGAAGGSAPAAQGRIAFVRSDHLLETADPDGRNLVVLARTRDPNFRAWSPDSRRIAWECQGAHDRADQRASRWCRAWPPEARPTTTKRRLSEWYASGRCRRFRSPPHHRRSPRPDGCHASTTFSLEL